MATSKNDILPYMEKARECINNPQAIQSLSLEHVEGMLDGRIRLVDATNPFATLLGISAANTAIACQSYIPVLRAQYPKLATTEDDLYNHMSDRHYIDRFASPVKQKVLALISYTELLERASVNPDGSRTATLRRFSSTEVDGVRFTLLYPVVIRIASNDIITVRYDVSQEHPLHTLGSDVVNWTLRKPSNQEQTAFFQLEVEMIQVKVKAAGFDINPAVGIDKTISFDDSFCYARVYYKGGNSTSWNEMHTTHSEMVYSSNTPTALLRVTSGKLNVKIPTIYFTQGMVTGRLRVEIFTSKGKVFLNTTGRSFTNFINDWGSVNPDPLTLSESALQGIPSKNFLFSAVVSGGTDALTFEQLKQRVIDDAYAGTRVAITQAQKLAEAQDMGFEIKTQVDTATTRQFLASKPLPPSRDRSLITPGSATMEPVLTSTGKLKASSWVADNGERITITPTALWKSTNGIIELVPDGELTEIMSLDTETRLAAINDANYMFSPFYYVLDSTDGRFKTRAYHLDNPECAVERFIGHNETTNMTVEIAGMQLYNNGNGWDLVVSTFSNDVWKSQDASYKGAQLNFAAQGVGALTAVNGVYAGVGDNGEDMFTFTLVSGFDVNTDHLISLLNFHAFTDEQREVFSSLEQIFNLVFISGAPMPTGLQSSNLDNMIVRTMLPLRSTPIFGQKVRLSFGKHLASLWTASRTLSPAVEYLTYSDDVFDVYLEDVLEVNPDNGTTVWFNPDGTPTIRVLHEAGSQRLDPQGNPIILHAKGSIVFDSGQPVPVSKDTLQRQFDILLLEGSYYFATDASTVEYVKEMTETISNYVTKDLPVLAESALDKSEISFSPKVTMGLIKVMIDAGVVMQIQSAQTLTVRLGVLPTVASNVALSEELKRVTIETVDNYFDNEVLSVSDLTAKLKSVYSGDVISISISGFGGSANADAITMLNTNERCSLKKRVEVLDSGEFTVREMITIDIFEHKTN